MGAGGFGVPGGDGVFQVGGRGRADDGAECRGRRGEVGQARGAVVGAAADLGGEPVVVTHSQHARRGAGRREHDPPERGVDGHLARRCAAPRRPPVVREVAAADPGDVDRDAVEEDFQAQAGPVKLGGVLREFATPDRPGDVEPGGQAAERLAAAAR